MARWTEPTPQQEKAWAKWVKSRPAKVRAIAERFPPWELFRMKNTGQRVTVYSFNEDGTIKVNVLAAFNALLFETQVFGVDPADLEPCDVPGDDEPTGAMMTGPEVDANIDTLRVLIRPDLFVLGDDGKAHRKS